MSDPFFITGLPRSRTAWMAVAASGARSLCLHEPVMRLRRWQDVFSDVWARQDFEFIGISDSGLGFHLEEIVKIAAPRTLVIERPLEEVENALAGVGVINPRFCEILASRLVYRHPGIKRVAFDALSNPDVVLDCLAHLMPGAAFNRDHIAQLCTMNIQVDHNAVRKVAQARAGDAAALLGADVLAELRQG